MQNNYLIKPGSPPPAATAQSRTWVLSLWLLLCLMASSLAVFGQTASLTNAYTQAGLALPTVTSDKDDYSPGDIAIITGSGWTLDAKVDVHLEEEPVYEHDHSFHDVIVEADGTWRVEYPIERRHMGVTFTVQVKGNDTGYEATTVFTDAITNVSHPASQNLCAGASTTFTATARPISLSVRWEFSDNDGGSWTTIQQAGNYTVSNLPTNNPNRTETVLTVSNVTAGISGRQYRAVFTENINPPIVFFTNAATLNVSPSSVGGTVSGAATVCSGSNSGTLTLSEQTGSVVRWQSSANGSTWTNITNTTTTLTYTNITTTTHYRAVVKSGECSEAFSAAAIITVTPLPQGSLSGSTICAGGTGTLTFTATSGVSPFTVVYSAGGTNYTATGVQSGTAFNVQVNPSATTTYTLVSVTDANCARTSGFTGGGSASITVNSSIGGIIGSGGNTNGPSTVEYCSATNNSTKFTVKNYVGTIRRWESSTNGGTTWVSIGFANTEEIVLNNVATTTQYRAIVQNGSCSEAASAVASIIINAPVITGQPQNATQAIGETATFTVNATGAGLTYQWYKGSVSTANLITGATNSTYSFAVTNAGQAGNYLVVARSTTCNTSVTSSAATLTVTGKQDQTITFGTLGNKTYGDAAFTLNATATSGLAVSYSIVSGNSFASISGNTVTITGAGDVTIRASQEGDGAYNAAPDVDRSFTIGKAATTTTITLAAGPFTYTGSAITPATVTVTGAGGLNLTPAAVYANNVNAGTATASYTYEETANYLASSDSEDFTIGKAQTTTVVTITGAPFTYTGSAITPATVTVTGPGLNLTPAAEYANNVNAGTATASYSYAESANYLASSDSEDFTIGKAPLTVTANTATQVYGDANPAFSVSYSGFVNGDDASDLGGTLAFETPATQSSPSGIYGIRPKGLTSSNYAITFVDGHFSITLAPLSVTADNESREYGDANPVFTGTITGIKNNDNITATYATTATAASAVGGYDITASLVNPTNKLDNYFVTNTVGTLTITKAALTVTTNAATKVYGDANPVFTGEITGIKNGDNITATYATTAIVTSSVGDYDITATLVDADGKLGNYTVTNAGNTLTVTAAPISVTADNKSKIYGAANPELTGVITGIKNGDAITATYTTVATAASAVADYPISASLTGTALSNYQTPVATNGTLTVDPKAITVTANNRTKTYGDALTLGTTEFSVPAGALVNGNTITGVTLTSTGAAASAAVTTVGNEYAITASNAVGTGLTNYTMSYALGKLTVNKKDLTITAKDRTKTYGDALSLGTSEFTTEGLVNSDAVSSVTLTSTGAAASTVVNSYPIVASAAVGTGLSNYNISYAPGTLTVDPRAITVKANNRTKTYGDVLSLGTTEFTVSLGNLVNGNTITGVSLASTGAMASADKGNYDITASDAQGTGLSNYNISYANGTLTVGARNLTITAANRTKTYGDQVVFAGTEFSTGMGQLANGDQIASVTLTSAGAAASATVTSYSIVPSVAVAAPGTDLANYNISYTNGTLTVDPKAITVTANNRTKTYGDALTLGTTEFSVPAGALVNGNTITGVTLTSTGATATAVVNTYAIVASTAVGIGLNNYSISYTNGTLTVGPRAITVKANDRTKTYGVELALGTTAFTVSVGNLVNGNTITGVTLTSAGAASSATVTTPGPTYPIVPSAAIGNGVNNYSITYENGTLTISTATLTVTANNANRAYSDPNPIFTASYSGFVNGDNANGLSGSLSFSTQATLTSPVGTYTIMPSGLTSTNYTIEFKSGTLTVGQEDATAEYTGAEFGSTGCSTCTFATVRLSANIIDAADGSRGNISTARARFRIVPLAGSNVEEIDKTILTSWVNVSLINSSDLTIGTAFIDQRLDIGSSNSKTYDIYVEVGVDNNGFYLSTSKAVMAKVTVSKTLNDFISGGGNLLMGSGSLNTSSGTYKSNDNSKTNFGFNVKYSKTGNNLQGNVNIIIRSGAQVYQVKGTVGGTNGTLSTNVSDPKNKKAVLNSKATLTNAETGAIVAENASLELRMTDKAEPGAKIDTYAITLRHSNGTLLYSSNWTTASKTDEVAINGGNIQVSSTSNFGTMNARTSAEEEVAAAQDKNLEGLESVKAAAYPNPFYDKVTLSFGKEVTEEVVITVVDMKGAVILTKKLAANSYASEVELEMTAYRSGTYVVQTIIGKNRTVTKVIKF